MAGTGAAICVIQMEWPMRFRDREAGDFNLCVGGKIKPAYRPTPPPKRWPASRPHFANHCRFDYHDRKRPIADIRIPAITSLCLKNMTLRQLLRCSATSNPICACYGDAS